MRRNQGEAHDTGASQEHRAASAGRWQAVALRSAAAVYCLLAGGGRTGAVGVPPRSHHERQVNGMPLSRYRHSLWVRSRDAG
jgi:hypothetical protein